jgi:hypothetical protein
MENDEGNELFYVVDIEVAEVHRFEDEFDQNFEALDFLVEPGDELLGIDVA